VKDMVKNYESIFIVNAEIGDDNIKTVVEKFKNLFETSTKLESIDEWGKKKLAYKIDDIGEGYYVLVNFSAEADFPQELERIYKIADEIIKYNVIRKE
jgi:small subunit ribosomal protein S6